VIDGADGRTSLVSNVLKVALGNLPPGSNTGGSSAAGTASLVGDFDGNGQVDGADFLAWQRGAGSAEELAAWQADYGISETSGATAALDAAFAGDSSSDFLESLRLANANLDLAGQGGEEVDRLFDDELDGEAPAVVDLVASARSSAAIDAFSQADQDDPVGSVDLIAEDDEISPELTAEFERAFASNL
jgi:hypothetical protein